MDKTAVLVVLAAIIFGFLAGQSLYVLQLSQTQIRAPVQEIPLVQPPEQPCPATIESSATVFVPAVDKKGNGAVVPLTVQKRAGYGETLINIKDLVFWFDTQESIQTAKDVAERHIGTDTSKINVVYIMNAHTGLVEGPSAGAALTITTIAALENRTLNESVMITGTINPDGSIGPVGGILEKARAAKGIGAKLFLVPQGQSIITTRVPVETCERRTGIVYCTTTYKKETVDVSESAGIAVKEVSTIRDAEKYFFG